MNAEQAGLLPAGSPPVMNAAGMIKTVHQAVDALRSPAGSVLLGSFTFSERAGNQGQTYFVDDRGSLNSAGLPSPPLETWLRIVAEVKARAVEQAKSLWVSVAGFSSDECVELTGHALSSGADVVEVNLGCPNVWAHGVQKPILSYDPSIISEVLAGVSSHIHEGRAVGIKLSPILDGRVLSEVHSAIRACPPSFVTAINTVPNCFAVGSAGRPAISVESGLAGMGGAATKWLALGQAIQHRQALPEIPIVGVGGISTGRDVYEMLSMPAAVDICQIGTAYQSRGPSAIAEILQELVEGYPGIFEM